MARYIDADALIADMARRYCGGCANRRGLTSCACWVEDAIGEIEDAPTEKTTAEQIANMGETWVSNELEHAEKLGRDIARVIHRMETKGQMQSVLTVTEDNDRPLLWAVGWYKIALKEAQKMLEEET